MAHPSSGLVDQHGDFFSNGQLWYRAFTGKLDRLGVADEIAAQAELFQKIIGRPPDYVDGHHHAHQLPVIRDALMDVMNFKLVPRVTRITTEARSIKWVRSVPVKRMAARYLGKRAARQFASQWTWSNDSFFGMLSSADLRRPFPWANYLSALPASGNIEWVVHPGLPDDSLKGRDDYNAGRVTELEALTSPAGAAVWEHLRLNLSRKSILYKKRIPSDEGSA